MRILVLLACLAGAACATTHASLERTSASPQARAYFERMMAAHLEAGVEQGACIDAWTLTMRHGESQMYIEHVRPAENVRNAHATGVTFDCLAYEGTAHTHHAVCRPSEIDKRGVEPFGVVVCPDPTRFAVFAVQP